MLSRKDRQEGAIYVFTIVTIIFLPISTVSSILGMNTTDIRNTDNGQWVFWAASIPLTALVLLASLYGAGLLTSKKAHFISGDENGRATRTMTEDYWDTTRATYT